MVSSKMIIQNPSGLHLRPISVLCNRAIEFDSTILLKAGDKTVNAKSVLGILSACVRFGDEIELICEGPDEEEAISVLSDMIQKGLGDEFIKK